MNKYFKKIGNTEKISSWKSKGLSDEIVKSLDNTLAPKLVYSGEKMYVKFDGNYLKQDKITFNHGKTVNIYIVYEITKNNPISNGYSIIENCLFGLIKNSTIHEFGYNEYEIGFDSKGTFSHPSGGFGRNVLIFGADVSLSAHANNKKRTILVLNEGIIQIPSTTLYAEEMYSVSFTENNKKFCLSLHYNGDNSYLFVNSIKIIKFKEKGSRFVTNPLCLGDASRETTANSINETCLYGHVFDCSVNYRPVAIIDILDIRKYLMKKLKYLKCLNKLKKCFL